MARGGVDGDHGIGVEGGGVHPRRTDCKYAGCTRARGDSAAGRPARHGPAGTGGDGGAFYLAAPSRRKPSRVDVPSARRAETARTRR